MEIVKQISDENLGLLEESDGVAALMLVFFLKTNIDFFD